MPNIQSSEPSQRRQVRLIVKFRSDISTADAQSLLTYIAKLLPQGKPVRPLSRTGRALFEIDPDADVEALVAQLNQVEGVQYAEPDIIDSAV
jgi:hypothetical protein